MYDFFSFSRFEWKRFFHRRNLVAYLILFVLCHCTLTTGIDDYRSSTGMQAKFKAIEQQNFKKHNYYSFYGDEGINILFIPAPTAVFSRNTPVPAAFFANIDTKETIRLFTLFKGKPLYRRNLAGPYGFSDVLLLLGSLLALIFGYDTLRHQQFLKMTASAQEGKKIFLSLVLSRMLIIIFLLLFLIFSTWLHLLVRGVPVFPGAFDNLPFFLLSSLLVLFFFFACGLIAGNKLVNPAAGFTVMFSFWFLVNFILPASINSFIEKKSPESTVDLEAEIQKMDIISRFEKSCSDNNGKFDINNIEAERRNIERYWQEVYPELEKLEEKIAGEIEACNDDYRFWSALVPAGFFMLTAEETGSKGVESFMDFYRYGKEKKRQFLRFWIDRVYYHDPKKLVNFIKNNENIYISRSRQPKNFIFAFLVNLTYIFSLMTWAYCSFMSTLYNISVINDKRKKKSRKKLPTYPLIDTDPHFTRGNYHVWYYMCETFVDLLYNIFSGRTKMLKKYKITSEFKISLDDTDITTQNYTGSFFYLCRSKDIPGEIKVKHLVQLFSGFNPGNTSFNPNDTANEKSKASIDLPVPSPGPGTAAGLETDTDTDSDLESRIKLLMDYRFSELTEDEKTEVLIYLSHILNRDVYLLNEIADHLSPVLSILLKKHLANLGSRGAAVLFMTSRINEQMTYTPEKNAAVEVTDLWERMAVVRKTS